MIAAASLTPTHIEVTAPFRMKNLLTAIPGSRAVRNSNPPRWQLRRTLASIVMLYAELGPDHLTMTPELIEFGRREKELEATAAALLYVATDKDAWDELATAELYGYQVPAVEYLKHIDSGVLGDDPGTGKSRMAAAWLGADHRPGRPDLVICPKTVQHQLANEIRTVHPTWKVMVLEGSAIQRRKQLTAFTAEGYDVLVTAYSQLTLHSRLAPYGAKTMMHCSECKKGGKAPEAKCQMHEREFNRIPWHSIVADEAHRLFNPEARWTRAAQWLGSKADRRLAMTGTPSENSPMDLLSLLQWAAPDDWPSRSKQQSFFMETELNYWGGAEVVGLRRENREIWDRLVARRFIRRPKSLVLEHLPAKVYQERRIDLPPKLRKQYDELKEEMMTELDTGLLIVTDRVVVHSRLIQAASATLTVVGKKNAQRRDEDGNTYVVEVDDVRMVEPSPKIDALFEILEDLGEQPVTIFATSRQLLQLAQDRFEAAGTPYAIIAGGSHPAEIEGARDEFNRGAIDHLLISVGAAAEGLNLTRGSTQIHLDRNYSRLKNVQAEDRQHGTGRGDQEADHLLIIDIVTNDTIEQDRADGLKDKSEGFEDLFHDLRAVLR